MAQELRRIDISRYPELVELAREVTSSDEPAVLQAGDEDLALMTPRPNPKRRSLKGRPFTLDDPLFRLMGIGSSEVPGGVSGNKHEALARAHHTHRS